MRQFVLLLALTIVSLVLVDLLLGQLIGRDYRPDGNALQAYFGYGVSTQTKLAYNLGDSPESARPIARAGWVNNIPLRHPPQEEHCRVNVTIYGMSFSKRVARQMRATEPCASLRVIPGPGAPLNHSYHMFEKHSANDDADIVVLTILASAYRKINGMAHFASAFEAPGSHLYPRYRMKGDALETIRPTAETMAEMRALLSADPSTLTKPLEQHDAFYSDTLFYHSWADTSLTLRMLRRAYGQRHVRAVERRYYDGQAFTNADQQLDVGRALIKAFHSRSIDTGVRPVVLLINDRGYAESLDNAFGDYLNEAGIPFVTSTTVIDSRDSRTFLPDGHYRPDLDAALTELLVKHIGLPSP